MVRRGRCLAVVIMTLFVSGLTVNADWSDNFDGGLQQAWVFDSVDALGMSSATFTAGSVNDRLELTDPTPLALGGAASVFGVVLEVFDDVMMTGVLNPDNDINTNDSLFLLARGDLINQTFYSLELNYSDSDLIIWRSDGLGTGSNIVQEPMPGGVNFTDSFYVEFEVLGDQLTARAYDALGGNLLKEISVTDTTYPNPGLSGVLVNSQFGEPSLPVLGVFDDLTATAIVSVGDPDFNMDGSLDCSDVDPLVADIAAGSNTSLFDLNGDMLVDTADLDLWLELAGDNNIGPARPYLHGDADLSAAVDVTDFNIWNANKFTNAPAWCSGDFNADGVVDVGDFNIWNGSKFTSSDVSSVPEPSATLLLMFAAAGSLLLGRRRS